MLGLVEMRIVAGLALALVACKSERPAQQAPPAPATPASASGSGSGTAAGSGSATAPGSSAAVAPAHVKLPRSPSTPPHRTSQPLDRAELDRLAAFEFPDFERTPRRGGANAVEVQHVTATRPKLAVTVTIEPCDAAPQAARPCLAMALDTWRARGDLRERSLIKSLAARPDTRFDLGATTVAGTPVIYTYQVAWWFEKDEHDQPTGSYSDAYNLYYNDGSNQIRVTAGYADDVVGSKAEMLALAPEEDLAKLAGAFLSFYIHEWK
jgi:hypothetical protein